MNPAPKQADKSRLQPAGTASGFDPLSEGWAPPRDPTGPREMGSRAVCVGSNDETARVRARASIQRYHQAGSPASNWPHFGEGLRDARRGLETGSQSRLERSSSASLQLSGWTRRAMSPRPKRSSGQSAVRTASMPASSRAWCQALAVLASPKSRTTSQLSKRGSSTWTGVAPGPGCRARSASLIRSSKLTLGS